VNGAKEENQQYTSNVNQNINCTIVGTNVTIEYGDKKIVSGLHNWIQEEWARKNKPITIKLDDGHWFICFITSWRVNENDYYSIRLWKLIFEP
jgi:hypothetical protein